MEEIKPLFEKHGHLSRFIMPKHGITVLVDFIEPFEAKKAFSKLAYSQFKTSPLYLEWAPENVFGKSVERKSEFREKEESKSLENDIRESKIQIKEETVQKSKESDQLEEDLADDNTSDNTEPENDTTLFIKNINFKTTEASLKKVTFIYFLNHKIALIFS